MKDNIIEKLKILKEYAEENFLISLTNKGIYNRALKDIKNIKDIKIEEAENRIKISFDGTEIFFTDDIKETACNCPSQKICKHIIIALLHIKKIIKSSEDTNERKILNKDIINIIDIAKEKNDSKTKNIKNIKKEKDKIIDDNILEFSKNFIENIFAKGFYSCHEKDFDTAEQIATKLNNDMPELSKLFRSLSQSIASMLSKKSFFNKIFVMKTLSKIYNTIMTIEEAKKNKDATTIKFLAGKIKSEYIEKSAGEFIGLGAYPWISSSGYFGLTSILYNLNLKKIYYYSYTIPTFYDNYKNYQNFHDDIFYNYEKKIHWENNISIETISKYKIKLTNYKINDEYRISSSKKTSAVLDERIDYNFLNDFFKKDLNSKKKTVDYDLFFTNFKDIKNIDFKYDYFNNKLDNKNKAKILITEFQEIKNINFDKINQILFFDILNNNEKLTLNIKYNKINSNGVDYIKNYKNSELDKNKFMVFAAFGKDKYFPISVININAVINIFFES